MIIFPQGYLPIPKASTRERIVANTQIFDFELTEDEVEHLDSLDEGRPRLESYDMCAHSVCVATSALVTDWEVTTCP